MHFLFIYVLKCSFWFIFSLIYEHKVIYYKQLIRDRGSMHLE